MASAAENGTIRVIFANKAETRLAPPIDNHTSVISGGAKAAPTGATYDAIPYTGNHPQRGGRIIVQFISDAADTIESEESDWEVPVILYDAKTLRQTGAATIKMEQFTGFTAAGTVDVVCAAGVPARLAYYDCAGGSVMGLNPAGKLRFYIGDDTA